MTWRPAVPTRRLLAVLALCAAAAPAAAELAWLPPPVQDAVARDLAAELAALPSSRRISDAERLDAARVAVAQTASRIDRWGVEGIFERSPEVARFVELGLDMPPIEDPRVAAIAAYGVCSLPLDPAAARSDGAVVEDALWGVSIALVAAYLRHDFLGAGGTDELLERDLASDRMNALSRRVVVDERLKAAVRQRCVDVYAALTE